MDFSRLDAIVDSYKNDIIADIQKWVAVPSVAGTPCENAPFGKDVRRALDTALETAKGYGFDVKEFDGYCGEISMREGEDVLGMLCHLDVVPAGDGWVKNPWGGEIEDNKLYGRGTMDDNGPAVAALHAMRAVREAGIPLKDGVRLILGCDEETGMTDMRHYREVRGKLPTYGFSPDAEFPVINIEKGGLGLELSAYSASEDEAEIPVISMYAGERANVVPGIATAKVRCSNIGFAALADKVKACAEKLGYALTAKDLGDNTAEISAEGKSAHASTPHLGKNAAGMLLIALADMNIGGGIAGAIKTLAEKIGIEYDGNGIGIKISDEESGALTCNLGLLRFDGHFLTIALDIRYPISAIEEKMAGQAAMELMGTPVSVKVRGAHRPHHVSKDHKVVKGLIKSYSDVTGTPGYAFAIGGGTYSRCMPNTVAFGFCFPGDADTCHMPDEFVDIDKLMLSVRIFAHAIAELAGEDA